MAGLFRVLCVFSTAARRGHVLAESAFRNSINISSVVTMRVEPSDRVAAIAA
jgi:hypothetical protein